MKFLELDRKNLKKAISIGIRCFPREQENKYLKIYYNDYVRGKCSEPFIRYYLVYVSGRPAGITGFYTLDKKTTTAWLGWFGVVPERRRHGLGSAMLAQTMKAAKKCGFKKMKLWELTEEASKFYRKNKFKKTKGNRTVFISRKNAYELPEAAKFYARSLG